MGANNHPFLKVEPRHWGS